MLSLYRRREDRIQARVLSDTWRVFRIQPLSVAAGERAVVELLLDHGADPLVTQQAKSFGSTALEWAEHFGRADAAAVLRERGGVATS